MLVRTGLLAGDDAPAAVALRPARRQPGEVRRHRGPDRRRTATVRVERGSSSRSAAGIGSRTWPGCCRVRRSPGRRSGRRAPDAGRPRRLRRHRRPGGRGGAAGVPSHGGSRLRPAERRRVHLACLPMDDVDENALIVNALQRHATIVVQKSLVEGFGLTVTEAMWKGRPVVATRGRRNPGPDHRRPRRAADDDPTDLDDFARVAAHPARRPAARRPARRGGPQRVLDEYLGDRHLTQYVDLFASLIR